MHDQITVGYMDHTSLDAVEWAASEATIRSAALLIVCCDNNPVGGDPGALPTIENVDGVVATKQESVRVFAEGVRARYPHIEIRVDFANRPARTALVEDAEHSDLLVVGPSRHRGASGSLLGNTPRWVARHSPCPVVVVHGQARRIPPERVVVGIDASGLSQPALNWAADEADLHGADLVVVHAWWYPYVGNDTRSEQARDLTRIDAACTLDRAVELARERCRALVTGELLQRGAISALLEVARDGDLLVVGTRGRGTIRSGLFGSTATDVIDGSSVPVVVVRDRRDEALES